MSCAYTCFLKPKLDAMLSNTYISILWNTKSRIGRLIKKRIIIKFCLEYQILGFDLETYFLKLFHILFPCKNVEPNKSNVLRPITSAENIQASKGSVSHSPQGEPGTSCVLRKILHTNHQPSKTLKNILEEIVIKCQNRKSARIFRFNQCLLLQ